MHTDTGSGRDLVADVIRCKGTGQGSNVLTPPEAKSGCFLLFDGPDLSQWRGAYQKDFPVRGWTVQDGELRGVVGFLAGEIAHENIALVMFSKVTICATRSVISLFSIK